MQLVAVDRNDNPGRKHGSTHIRFDGLLPSLSVKGNQRRSHTAFGKGLNALWIIYAFWM